MTNAAGYCLLARGEQNGMPLMVAILGGVTDEAKNGNGRGKMRAPYEGEMSIAEQ